LEPEIIELRVKDRPFAKTGNLEGERGLVGKLIFRIRCFYFLGMEGMVLEGRD